MSEHAHKFSDEQIEAAKKLINEQIEKTRESIKNGLTVYKASERSKKNRAKRQRKALR